MRQSLNGKAPYLAWTVCLLIVGVSLFNLAKSLLDPLSAANNGAFILYGFMIPIIFALLAALILSRQPNNLIGWLVMMPAVLGLFPSEAYIRSFTSAPTNPPLLLLLAFWFYNWSWLLLIFPIFFIPILFPTGKPLSPHWRWLIVAGLAMCGLVVFLATFTQRFTASEFDMDWTIVNPIGFIPPDLFDRYLFVPWALGLLSMTVLSVVSLFIRYRRAPVVERQQIKWLLYACALFAALYIPANALASAQSYLPELFNSLSLLTILAIPGAIAMAILRYRLWDIDLIIRRTLQYSLVSGLLAMVYFGSVVVGQRLAGLLTGSRESPLVLVVSTLLMAALFNPLRRRVQDFIDRRFYRRKVDAEQALAAFTRTARDETRLEALEPALLEVVQDSLQPEQAWLWLKRKGQK